jgi:hypothetical protein
VAETALIEEARAKVAPRAAHLVARAEEAATRGEHRVTEPNDASIAVALTLREESVVLEAHDQARRRRATSEDRTPSARTAATTATAAKTAKCATPANGVPVQLAPDAPDATAAHRRDQAGARPVPTTLAAGLVTASATTATLVALDRVLRRAARIATTAPARTDVPRARHVPETDSNALRATAVRAVRFERVTATKANHATAVRVFRRVEDDQAPVRGDAPIDARES